jgi:4-hydroxybenzoate polyprenyltransferase
MQTSAVGKAVLLDRVWPYIAIARIDHWFKNVFVFPGVIFAIYDRPGLISWEILPKLILGLLAIGFVASSNYTINEILDAPHDALHPVKKHRPVPSGQVVLKIAYLQWVILALTGLAIGWFVNPLFMVTLAILLGMGLVYNLPLLRFKDLPYIDVLTESLNNPLRLLLGWFIVNTFYPPTLSLVMAYWMIGAFFMATKRYAEYRRIADPQAAASYRKSFAHYSESRLLLTMFYYASSFGLFFGIFMIRYRIELILSIPFIAGFITMYMRLGFREDSPVQYPESLYRQKHFMVYFGLCMLLVLGLLFIDIPILEKLFAPTDMTPYWRD